MTCGLRGINFILPMPGTHWSGYLTNAGDQPFWRTALGLLLLRCAESQRSMRHFGCQPACVASAWTRSNAFAGHSYRHQRAWRLCVSSRWHPVCDRSGRRRTCSNSSQWPFGVGPNGKRSWRTLAAGRVGDRSGWPIARDGCGKSPRTGLRRPRQMVFDLWNRPGGDAKDSGSSPSEPII